MVHTKLNFFSASGRELNCICLVLSVTHYIYSSLVLTSDKGHFCCLKGKKQLAASPNCSLVTSAKRLAKITFSPLYGPEQMNLLNGFKGCTCKSRSFSSKPVKQFL